MPRQYFIPGQGAINETGRRQYFIPGMSALNEPGVANSSASFTESLTAADSFAPGMTASATLADSTTPADTYQSVPRYHSAFVPGGYAINEGIARQFFVPGRGGINLTGRAKIIPPVTVAASYTIMEPSTAAESLANTGSFNAPTSDFAFASDLPAAQSIFSATYGDIALGDTQYGSIGVFPVAARSGGASAAYGEIALGETQYGSLGGATYNPTFTAPYVTATYRGQIVEPVTIADMLAAMAAFGESLNESSTPGDDSGAALPGHQPLVETLATAADIAGIATFVVALGEAIAAGDSMSAFIDIPTPLYRIIRADGHAC